MKHSLWVASLLTVIGLVTVAGCSPKSTASTTPRHRVAGTQQHFAMPAGTTRVTVTLNSTGITVLPRTVPQGPVRITIINKTKAAHAVTLAQTGLKPMTRTVKSGASITVAMLSAKPGAVSISVPSAIKGGKMMSKSFMVNKGGTSTVPKTSGTTRVKHPVSPS